MKTFPDLDRKIQRAPGRGALGYLFGFWLALVFVLFASAPSATASVTGPYVSDGNTLLLFHLDEASGATSTAKSGTAAGGNGYAVNESTATSTPSLVTGCLGGVGYTGFGNAAVFDSTTKIIGWDYNNNGAFNGASGNTSSSVDQAAGSMFNMSGVTGSPTSFTVECMMYCTMATLNSGSTQDMITTDGGTGTRGMRLSLSGSTLQFEAQTAVTPVFVSGTLPNSGTHAYAANTWFHVAVTYDGATPRLYWTKVDPTVTAANLLATGTANTTNYSATYGTTAHGNFTIGGENRGSNGEPFIGRIDEVRISKVARSASQFIFSAAGPATSLALTSGTGQSGAVGTALAAPFVVTVTDAGGLPVSGVSVTFAIMGTPGGAAGQALSATNATTTSNGQATCTLTLGNALGTYTVTGSAAGLAGSPVTFTANAYGNLAVTSVNGGSSPTAAVPFSVTVQAQDGSGTATNVAANTVVTLSRATGTGALGGTLTGTIAAGSSSASFAGVTYTKVESGVSIAATRSSGDSLATGTSVAFSVVTGSAATLSLTSGNNQTGLAGAALASPFVVTVTDAGGNPVSGVGVTYAIATVPGSATGQVLSATSATTGTNGQASSTFTSGNTLGSYTITATVAGLTGSPATFTATATGSLSIVSVNGGVSPTAGIGFNVAVVTLGSGGVPVFAGTNTGISLSRATGTGVLGGTTTGTVLASSSTATISNVTYTKAESGVSLTVTRTSGATLIAGTSTTFTVVAGAATTIALTSGNNQSAVAGTALASLFVVTVTDANGNPVNGTSVTFAVNTVPGGATGQSLTNTSTTTGINGQASSRLTVGSMPGTYTVTATSTGLTGSPLTFTATATGGLVVTSVNGGVDPIAGAPFNVVVQAQGIGGNPFNVTAATTISLSRAVGSGTLGGTLTGIIPSGSSSVTFSVSYTRAESGIVLAATRTAGDALATGSSAGFTVDPGPAVALVMTSGSSVSGQKAQALAAPFLVTAADVYGNGVPGIPVTFAITATPIGATGQVLSATSTTTASNGQAASTLTLGNVAGAYYIVLAASPGLSGSPLNFYITAYSGNYLPVASATYDYQICFKCHSSYAWGTGTVPNGLSPNGSVSTPVQTDAAQEFNPNNKSGHPVVTGLDNYPNSSVVGGKRGLLAAAMKAPWNVNLGTQTMMCTDCHNTDSSTPAAQGPHGSASQYMLRGANAANWPAVTLSNISTSWCANCHNDSAGAPHTEGNHKTGSVYCYTCHIVVPHGGKVSRLIVTSGTGSAMPARYAYNNNKANTGITQFTKSATGSYSENNSCRTSCGHHSGGTGTETW